MADITQNFSQLLLTYGPGAMLDLPENAVVVAGLQDWDYKGSNWRPVEEERLVALLRQQLGAKLSPTFSGLRHPPMFDEDRRDSNAPGVAVRLFSSWFLVDEAPAAGVPDAAGTSGPANEKRRRMVEFSELDVKSNGKLSYTGSGSKRCHPGVRVAPVPEHAQHGHLPSEREGAGRRLQQVRPDP